MAAMHLGVIHGCLGQEPVNMCNETSILSAYSVMGLRIYADSVRLHKMGALLREERSLKASQMPITQTMHRLLIPGGYLST